MKFFSLISYWNQFNFTATDRLYVEFLESLQAHGTEQQVFEVIADYIQTCSDTLQIFHDVEDKLAPKHPAISIVSINFKRKLGSSIGRWQI